MLILLLIIFFEFDDQYYESFNGLFWNFLNIESYYLKREQFIFFFFFISFVLFL